MHQQVLNLIKNTEHGEKQNIIYVKTKKTHAVKITTILQIR